jgi:hypothetical protein
MGMFDTFHIHDRGRELVVQSKRFACQLDEYRIGDFVSFDHGPPTGITAWIENHKHDWRDPTCPVEWVVILLVDGCFLDAFVSGSESEARQAADVMVKLWQSPERQAQDLKRHALDHYDARMCYRRGLERLAALLHDYASWDTDKAMGEKVTQRRCLLFQHDFDKETWDWAVARLLLDVEGFREHVPEKYVSADQSDETGR